MTEGVDYRTIWKDWLIDLFLQPAPHRIHVEKLRGFDVNRMDEFREPLSRLESNGWVCVDFVDGVRLTEWAFEFLAVNALRRATLSMENAHAALVMAVLGDGARDALADAVGRLPTTSSGFVNRNLIEVPEAMPVTKDDLRFLEGR